MTPLIGLGVPELLIILAVVLILFGGSRLAGIGKSSGKAIREFKEETRSIRDDEAKTQPSEAGVTGAAAAPSEAVTDPTIHEAEVIDPDDRPRA